MKNRPLIIIASVAVCSVSCLVLYRQFVQRTDNNTHSEAVQNVGAAALSQYPEMTAGTLQSPAFPNSVPKEEVYSVPSRTALNEQQSRILQEFELELNRLTDQAARVRLKVAALKSSRLRTEPALVAEMGTLKKLESEFDSVLQSNPDVQKAQAKRDEARKVYDHAEVHHETLVEKTNSNLTETEDENWKNCSLCRSLIATMPAHGPSSHIGVASMAKELARNNMRDATADFIGVQRELKAGNDQIKSKWDEALNLRRMITAKLDQFPEIAQLLEQEKRLLAEHAAIGEKCREIYQSAKREPVQSQQPFTGIALGAGT